MGENWWDLRKGWEVYNALYGKVEEGLWGEKDGGKFGNELLDFGYGVGWFLARVWSGGGLEGQMEKGGGGSIVDHLSDLFCRSIERPKHNVSAQLH